MIHMRKLGHWKTKYTTNQMFSTLKIKQICVTSTGLLLV